MTHSKCRSCTNPPIPGKTRCPTCAEKHKQNSKALLAKRLEMGLCRCGATLNGKQNCESCAIKSNLVVKKRRQLYTSKGLCYCGDQPLSGRTQCQKCWLRSLAGTHHTSTKSLIEIWEKQKGRCALTGAELRMGDNASLDHKLPMSRGGTNKEENLQWVTKVANGVKTDLTPEELVSFCISVLRQQGYQVLTNLGSVITNMVVPQSRWNNHHVTGST